MRTPPLGIFLDVDGPVSSPETRTVAAALLEDVGALLAIGVPVALNTGRSTDFAAEHVLRPLVAAGLPPASRLHAICEKGGSWMTPGSLTTTLSALASSAVRPDASTPAIRRAP